MRELREWLHWAINETQVPALERAEKAYDLQRGVEPTPEWWITLGDAADALTHQGRGESFGETNDDVAWCLEHHPAALRDLCLAFADAIEKMREQVPEAPPPLPTTSFVIPANSLMYGQRFVITDVPSLAEQLFIKMKGDALLMAGTPAPSAEDACRPRWHDVTEESLAALTGAADIRAQLDAARDARLQTYAKQYEGQFIEQSDGLELLRPSR